MRKFLVILILVTGMIGYQVWQLNRASVASAVGGDLMINWGVPEGEAIFNVPSLAPGQVEVREVVVENIASSARVIGVRSVEVVATGEMAKLVQIVVKDETSDLYAGSLKALFEASLDPNGVILKTLAAGEKVNLQFEVSLPEELSEQKERRVEFDISLGVLIDIPEDCTDIEFDSFVMGSERSDSLRGTAGNDLIVGLEGSDSLRGGGGDDCLVGGAGSDSLRGGQGNDQLFAGVGNDSLRGNSGNDYLDAGQGQDSARGGRGVDECVNAESNRGCEVLN